MLAVRQFVDGAACEIYNAPVKRAPQPVEAVLFDLDGTLIATDLDFAAMKQALLRLTAEFSPLPSGLEQLDMLSIIQKASEQIANAWERAAYQQAAEELLVSFELPAARLAEEIPPARKVVSALVEKGVRVGLVTRNCRSAALVALGRVPLPHQVLLTRNDVAHPKPHPEQLLEAARLLKAQPQLSIMVGDHPMDVQGGKSAGMFTVGVVHPPHTRERFDECPPDVFVSSLDELLCLI